MTQGFDRNVQVLTAGAFQQLYRQAASLNIADPLARLMLRLFLGSAIELPAGKSTPGDSGQSARLCRPGRERAADRPGRLL